MGTATFVTNSQSQATQFFLNLPFGETMIEQMDGSYDNPFKFNAKELDEDTGLYYYGARYYNPRLSIWYGVDPLAEKYPTWSPYAYTFDNPVRFIDPDGREPIDPPVTFSNKYVSNVLNGKRFSNYSNPVFTLGKILQGKSPIVFNCWDAAARQVEHGGNYETSTKNRVNMSGLESQKNLNIDVQKGVDLIVSILNEGKSVVAGIDYGPNQEGVNNSNQSTDHFVNIVGYGKDKKGYFFSYYDNAIEGGEKEGVNIEKNRFYYDKKTNRFIDDKAIHGKKAVLSEVRETISRPTPTLKTNNSYRQYP